MSTPAVITSGQNPRVKLVRKLASKNGRARERLFVAEGEDLVAAAAHAGTRPEFLLVDGDVTLPVDVRDQLGDRPIFEITSSILAEISALGYPPRALGVYRIPDPSPPRADAPVVWLDGARDPGNVGTVVRSVAAFGGAGVLLARGTADPYSPKAVRASMGAIFSIPVQAAGGDGTPRAIGAGRTVVALDVSGDVDLWDVDLGHAPVLCIGAERSGLSEVVRATADIVCRIPQRSDVDSINAAMAASISLYEWERQQARGDT